MSRRLAMTWMVLVVALALALPAETLAINRYRAYAFGNYCTLAGGANGYGEAGLSVQAKEVGLSGVNHFKTISKVQQGPSSTGPWQTYATWPAYWSTPFPNDSTSNHIEIYREFAFTSDAQTKYHRIVIKIQYWSYALGLRAIRTVKGKAC